MPLISRSLCIQTSLPFMTMQNKSGPTALPSLPSTPSTLLMQKTCMTQIVQDSELHNAASPTGRKTGEDKHRYNRRNLNMSPSPLILLHVFQNMRCLLSIEIPLKIQNLWKRLHTALAKKNFV